MFLCVNIDDFDKEKILINNKIRNNIITNSFFYRVYSTDSEFISNGIVIDFYLKDVKFEKYFNKCKIIFNRHSNTDIVKKLNKIENDLLSSLNIEKRKKKFLIKEQVDNHFLKIIHDKGLNRDKVNKSMSNCRFIIKISGLWESKLEYGLTFRCIKVENQYN